MARDPIKAKIKRNAKGKIIATTLTPKDYETLKNSDYWLARQAEHDIALQKDYEQTIANMQKMYWREANRLDQLIANYFTKYGKDNVIKYSDLMKKLKPDERKQLIESADDYLSAHPEQQAIVDVRKSIYKLNRLEGLRASLEIQAANMAVIEQSRAEQFLRNAYATSYGQMAEDLGMGKQFNFYDPNVMNATINQKWVSEEAFSDRIWKNRTSLANYIQRDFAQGVARGEDYKQLSKAMTNRFRTQSETNIRRVINTEYIRIQNEAKAESMEYLGDLAWYKIHEDYTKPDTMCQEMDGKSFRLKDRETGRNCPPFHPNCHGFIAPDSSHFPTKDQYEKQLLKAANGYDDEGKSLNERLDVEDEMTGEQYFLPGGVLIKHDKIIAGDGSHTKLRAAERLANDHGGKPKQWSKYVGKVESDKYNFDVHWYENGKGEQFERKVKNRGDRK